ncbi:glycerate kinase [Rhodonellum sp.]|uniref:glycerate kinase n=1 Tax=Rhodonellum sp. TaxID=2231180 RepID=UPI002717E9AF|nr:glycerate kinase [Rhodonellum sp.]MDO9553006.1 glycerate kinase [Rhodonellum sp.]
MKVLIAPNAFKGTVEADEASVIIGLALKEVRPDFESILSPIADGGDGTCFLLGKAMGLPQTFQMALDALGRPILGFYYLDVKHQTAYLDVSTVSGIKNLKPYELNPWTTGTYGTGELIRSAIDGGAKHIVLGLGGSATMDMGLGILRALGFIFLDKKGREISMFSEGIMGKIAHIQNPIPKPDIKFTCLCDVNNYFWGSQGAIPVFGPQKGLKETEIIPYENACKHFSSHLEKKSKKTILDQEGFGAAGGIAFGLSAFFPMDLKMGANWFFEKTGMEGKIKNADLIITGEGRYDSQSAGGKGSYELLQMAKKFGKHTVLITSGNGGDGSGFDQVIHLPELNFNEPTFVAEAKNYLYDSVLNAFKL